MVTEPAPFAWSVFYETRNPSSGNPALRERLVSVAFFEPETPVLGEPERNFPDTQERSPPRHFGYNIQHQGKPGLALAVDTTEGS